MLRHTADAADVGRTYISDRASCLHPTVSTCAPQIAWLSFSAVLAHGLAVTSQSQLLSHSARTLFLGSASQLGSSRPDSPTALCYSMTRHLSSSKTCIILAGVIITDNKTYVLGILLCTPELIQYHRLESAKLTASMRVEI